MPTRVQGVPVQPDVKLTITDARNQLPELVKKLHRKGGAIGIGPREELEAVLISAARFEELAHKEAHPEVLVATLVAERLLGKAPPDLMDPQVRELAALEVPDLALLLGLEGLPQPGAERERVRTCLSDPVVLERLEKRHQIAKAIAEAEAAGLYETAEHQTSTLDTWKKDALKGG